MKPCHGWSEMLRTTLLQDADDLFTVVLEGAGQLEPSLGPRVGPSRLRESRKDEGGTRAALSGPRAFRAYACARTESKAP